LTEQNLTYMSLPMVINQNQNKNTVPTIINLTPHIVRIAGPSDELLGEWAPSGRAVVSMETTVDKQLSESIGFSVGRTVYGKTEGLPPPSRGTYYIVSSIVRAANLSRHDLLTPDTGPDCLRREGLPYAARRFLIS
jgi:hypothetical protein